MSERTRASALGANGPLYDQVKRFVAERIASGEWPRDHRIPSENQLTRDFGVSRMTVNRALRELAAEGILVRVRGVGTFVAETKPQSTVVELKNIADEIAARGHRHSCDVHVLWAEKADPTTAWAFGLPTGARIFHSLLVHRENDIAVQLEDRYVNPVVAPDYLEQDFTVTTPNAHLVRVAPPDRVEHVIEAILPDPYTARLLAIEPNEPCLLLRRRTWSGGTVASTARLVHPGSRYRLGGSFAYRGPAAAEPAGPRRQGDRQ